MKLLFLTVILIGYTFTAVAQTLPLPVRFKNCKKVELYFLSAEVTPEWKKKDKDLTTYFNEKLENYQDFKKADGNIKIEIFIFEDGKTCCASFTNMTNTELDPDVFKEIINNMPDWKAATQRGKTVVFLKQLVLTIYEGKIVEK